MVFLLVLKSAFTCRNCEKMHGEMDAPIVMPLGFHSLLTCLLSVPLLKRRGRDNFVTAFYRSAPFNSTLGGLFLCSGRTTTCQTKAAVSNL